MFFGAITSTCYVEVDHFILVQLLQPTLIKLIADHNHVVSFLLFGYFGSQAEVQLAISTSVLK